MNYKPFDLEIALKNPERVITRCGLKVSELAHFKTAHKESDSIVAIINGNAVFYRENGKYYQGDHPNDLFLLPEEKKVWINVYRSECTSTGFSVGNTTFNSEEDAKRYTPNSHDYHTTIPATIPV